MAAETVPGFGPDTLPEARNRGYHLAGPAAPAPKRPPSQGRQSAVEHRFPSGGHLLAAHLARTHRPAPTSPASRAVVLAHGYPANVALGGDRRALDARAGRPHRQEMGWLALAMAFRGCGESEGNFSLRGWIDDVHAAVGHLGSETT